jgi:4-aminobutyrate aminotransferase/(S)-3-amino-2-methylpropionate transaminase
LDLTQEISALDGQYLMQCFPARQQIVITGASGTTITDSAGNKYLDLFSGISVANVGHCHPKVVAAVREQVGRYMHVSNYYYNDVMPQLAKKLVSVSPNGLKKAFFCNSGTEANDGAIKLAKLYSAGKGSATALVSLEGSFHGRLSLTLSLSGQKKLKRGLGSYANYPGITHAPVPYHYRYGNGLDVEEFGRNCAEKFQDMLDYYAPGDVCAAIIEPILGEGGIIVPPDSYLPMVQQICKDRRILFIVDEVQTGVARTGKMFASELWKLRPDIMTVAKAIGGGLPIGAFIATDEVATAFTEGDHFTTFGGNPVSCAAGIATLDVIIEEKLVEKAESIGQEVIHRLGEIVDQSALIGEVRGRGLMIGVELVRNKKTRAPADKEAAEIKKALLKKGFLIGLGGLHKNVLRLQPPLIITREEINIALDTLEKSLSDFAKN